MAITYSCDRCGNEDKYIGKVFLNLRRMDDPDLPAVDLSYQLPQELDLCPTCRKHLIDFLSKAGHRGWERA